MTIWFEAFLQTVVEGLLWGPWSYALRRPSLRRPASCISRKGCFQATRLGCSVLEFQSQGFGVSNAQSMFPAQMARTWSTNQYLARTFARVVFAGVWRSESGRLRAPRRSSLKIAGYFHRGRIL